ncbi:hypothetical protein B0H10DRAFT_1411550 [Mycena sp. CBHHK59/15]|nr:hypothetical protein B0H10DRAFT_1411550 [Mycena sp. CBHHK59/15]
MEFRRCSGCLSLYYCSKKCQILDWQEGRHRSLCRIIQNRRQRECLSRTRDKSFMRALLHAHFDTCKQDIYVRQAMRLRQHPSNHVCTLFDYTRGPLRLEISTVAPPITSPDLDDLRALRVDLVSRVQRSGGRMEIGLIELEVGGGRRKLLPMRSSSGIVHDGLRRIANELPPGLPDDLSAGVPELLIEKIQTLAVRTEGQVMQIH